MRPAYHLRVWLLAPICSSPQITWQTIVAATSSHARLASTPGKASPSADSLPVITNSTTWRQQLVEHWADWGDLAAITMRLTASDTGGGGSNAGDVPEPATLALLGLGLGGLGFSKRKKAKIAA